ncbi:LysR family transcriptional regulator [Paenibacillus sp. Lou8.1]|uniref:LysR family transcriptional regulator n=1 Tax=Paenibacillus sp. Lou8.1 TaxID=2962041 RepID=UPI0020B6ECF2|nr:LysR family transcriptional regulator [Paenibacillus sp. Lou8.1]MCP3809361.1 LysR family transcriptional regulator [Paenibacillus sp. Lou8.1]
MELRHLKYFKTVAEELHFGKAANRLNMAQPPLSLQIRQLEEEIGVQLFHRTKRNVDLTEEGKVFLEKVYHLFDHLEEAIHTVRLMKSGEIGEIIIGFIASTAYDILPAIIKHYRAQYPAIHVVLKQLTSSEQINALKDGTIHVGIISEPIESEEINLQIIRQEPLIIALPREHPLVVNSTTASPIQLIDLENEEFIVTGRRANQGHYDGVINSCYQAGFSPRIVQETEEMSTVISLVSTGIGVALVPASMHLLLQNEVIYREIKDNEFHTVTALVWDSKNQSPVIQTFIELVNESIVPLFNP